MIPDSYLLLIIERAFAEDIGEGDHSSLSCIPEDKTAEAVLLVKEDGIIAGVEVAKKVIHYYSQKLNLETFIDDGVKVSKGDVVFKLCGPQRDILAVERTILNFMQRMSGIATQTNQYVQKLQGLKTKVLDTRKTTPGLRLIEKEAVKIGGGENHRFGLYDMIMLKDNHIDYAGGIKNAIIAANEYIIKNNLNLKIEIEVRNIDELRQVLEIGKVHRIMLDNFDIPATKKAVGMIDGKYETESSGGITLDTIRQYAECGVDYISVGALTHHIKSLDLSLKAVKSDKES